MRKITTLGLCFAVCLLGGCTKFIYSEDLLGLGANRLVAKPVNNINGSALIAIRWPVISDISALSMLEDNIIYGNRSYFRAIMPSRAILDGYMMVLPPGGYWWVPRVFGLDRLDRKEHANLSDKSTYYAAELYRRISQLLPEATILLEPQLLSANGKKFSQSSLYKADLPVAFTIDITSLPLTQYHNLALGFNFNTSGFASPKTCGAIASDYKSVSFQAFNEPDCLLLSSRGTYRQSFIDYYYSDNGDEYSSTSLDYIDSYPVNPGQFVNTVINVEQFADGYLAASAQPSFNSKSGLQNSMIDFLAKVIADGVSKFDLIKASQISVADYTAEYDSELARKLKEGKALNENEQYNKALLQEMAAEEVKFYSKEDANVASNILDGPYGQSFRATRYASKLMDDHASNAANNMAISMMQANMSQLSTGHMDGMASLQNVITTLSVYQDDINKLREDFYKTFGGEFAKREEVLKFKIAGNDLEISTKDRATMRNELKKYYLQLKQ